MIGWTARLSRRALLIGAVVVFAFGVLVPAALATTTNYFGYANLTANNPAADSCFAGSEAGLACSGWASWDYSQAEWNSGRGEWVLGYICQADGKIHGRLFYGTESFNTYTILWSDPDYGCPGHYNRVAVAHVSDLYGSYNYLQGRAIKF